MDFESSGRRFVLRYGIASLAAVCLFGFLLTNSWLVVVLLGAIGVGALVRSRRISLVVDRVNGSLHLDGWRGTRSIPVEEVRCYRFGKRYSAGPQRILFVLIDGTRVASYGFCIDELFSYLTAAQRRQITDRLEPLRPCEDGV